MSETPKTNFDAYLAEQLTDPEFAERFERAGREWDLALQSSAAPACVKVERPEEREGTD